MDIYEQMQAIGKVRHISMQNLSLACGTNKNNFSVSKQNKSFIKLTTLNKLLKVLNYSLFLIPKEKEIKIKMFLEEEEKCFVFDNTNQDNQEDTNIQEPPNSAGFLVLPRENLSGVPYVTNKIHNEEVDNQSPPKTPSLGSFGDPRGIAPISPQVIEGGGSVADDTAKKLADLERQVKELSELIKKEKEN